MAYCSNCGAELAEGVKFCAECGAKVGDVKVVFEEVTEEKEVIEEKEVAEVTEERDFAVAQSSNAGNVLGNEKKPNKFFGILDKFGKVVGIVLFILALVDFNSDPPFVTILLSLIIIAGSVLCFIRKYKWKVFPILAIIMAVVCMICGFSQAKEFGLFVIPAEEQYEEKATEIAEQMNDTTKEADESKEVDESKEEKETEEPAKEVEPIEVTYAGLTFSIPADFIADDNKYDSKDQLRYVLFETGSTSYDQDKFLNAGEALDQKIMDEISDRVDSCEKREGNFGEIAGYTCRNVELDIVLGGDEAKMFVTLANVVEHDQALGIFYVCVGSMAEEGKAEYNAILSSAREAGENAGSISSSKDSKETVDGVDPDLKAFLDEYEQFMDGYVEFMQKYMKNPADLSLLGDYAKMLEDYEEFAEKVDAYDSDSMSAADASYYLEVTTRVSQKMLTIME